MFYQPFSPKEDIAVVELASQLMIIAALFQLSDGIQVTALGCLRGNTRRENSFYSYLYRLLGHHHSIMGYYLTVPMKWALSECG